jgi:hypothetical protein
MRWLMSDCGAVVVISFMLEFYSNMMELQSTNASNRAKWSHWAGDGSSR